MKLYLSILALVVSLTSCILQSTEPEPRLTDGRFVIIEYAEPGTIKRTWIVKSYYETDFPKMVYFDHNGKRIVLKDVSYQINEFAP